MGRVGFTVGRWVVGVRVFFVFLGCMDELFWLRIVLMGVKVFFWKVGGVEFGFVGSRFWVLGGLRGFTGVLVCFSFVGFFVFCLFYVRFCGLLGF